MLLRPLLRSALLLVLVISSCQARSVSRQNHSTEAEKVHASGVIASRHAATTGGRVACILAKQQHQALNLRSETGVWCRRRTLRIIFLDGPGRRSDHTANVVACKEARGVADHVQAVWALLTERCAALKTLLRSRWHRVVIMTRADEDPAASRGQRRSGSGRVLAERSSPERRALPLAARLAAGAVGLVALAGIVAAAGAVCASSAERPGDSAAFHQGDYISTIPRGSQLRHVSPPAVEPIPEWARRETSGPAVELRKAEKELEMVVRHLEPQECGLKQDCVVCLRTIRGRKDNWVVLPCDHGMCSSCFTTLVTTQVRTTKCPLCRARALPGSDDATRTREQLRAERRARRRAEAAAAAAAAPAAVSEGDEDAAVATSVVTHQLGTSRTNGHDSRTRRRQEDSSVGRPEGGEGEGASAVASVSTSASPFSSPAEQNADSRHRDSGEGRRESGERRSRRREGRSTPMPARSLSTHSNNSETGSRRRAWWLPKDKPPPKPIDPNTVATVVGGRPGETGAWAMMGRDRIWLPNYTPGR